MIVVTQEMVDQAEQASQLIHEILEGLKEVPVCPEQQKEILESTKSLAENLSYLMKEGKKEKKMSRFEKFAQIGSPEEIRMTRTGMWDRMRIRDDGYLYVASDLVKKFYDIKSVEVPHLIKVCRRIKTQIAMSMTALEAKYLDETEQYKALAEKNKVFRRRLNGLENRWALPFTDWLKEKGEPVEESLAVVWTLPEQNPGAFTLVELKEMSCDRFDALWTEYALRAPWKADAYEQDTKELEEMEKDISILVKRIIETSLNFRENEIEEEVVEVDE